MQRPAEPPADSSIRAAAGSQDALPTRLAQVFDRATRYLLGRQCADGGFCFYRYEHLEESNLADTYHAVATLKMLDRGIPREGDVVAFLKRFPATGQPSDLHYLVGARLAIEPTFCPDEGIVRSIRDLRFTLPHSPSHLSGWLERTRLIARLKRDFTKITEVDVVRRWLENAKLKGGFGSRPNLHDTWLALEILDACGVAGAFQEIADFIDRLQVESFGFTDTLVGTTANLDVIAAGVRSCVLLGLPIRYPNQALRFALQCQTARGGFARAPDALPDIEYTCEAVTSLLSLSAAIEEANSR